VKKAFRDVRIGDIVRLPKAGFEIVHFEELISQSDEPMLEVSCICTDPSLVGVEGKFLILAKDKVDIIERNTLGKRFRAWFKGLFFKDEEKSIPVRRGNSAEWSGPFIASAK
jgi:hypothetical protein